jgi:hypothetical protein
VDELPRELADQIAAGNPRGQPKTLSVGGGFVDGTANVEQMRMRVERGEI